MHNLFHLTDTEKTFSVLTVDTTQAVQEMQNKHKLKENEAAALGQLLTAAALLSTMLVQDETITLTAEGILNCGTAVAVAEASGAVRGFFDEDEAGDAKRAVPMLRVMRRAGLAEPRMSFCLLTADSVEESLHEYLRTSQQMDALCRLETRFSKDGEVVDFAGGVCFLPWTKTQNTLGEAVRETVESVKLPKFLKANGVKSPLEKAFPNEAFLRRDEKTADYRCTCSLERMERGLQSIGAAALSELLEDEFTEMQCHFCGHKYLFSRESIRTLLQEMEESLSQ